MAEDQIVEKLKQIMRNLFDGKVNLRSVDVRCMDLQGLTRPFSIPISQFPEEALHAPARIQIDGSSIWGLRGVEASDTTLELDPTWTFADPFRPGSVFMFGYLLNSNDGTPYDKDPRGVARKALQYLKKTGIGDVANFAPEAEFFTFNNVRWGARGHSSFFKVDTVEGPWHTGSGVSNGGTAHIAPPNYSYSQDSPIDTQWEWRQELVDMLVNVAGMPVEAHNAEVGPCQNEINIEYANIAEDKHAHAPDRLAVLKYLTRNHAARHGFVATFMPKPLGHLNGSGMHTNMSIWKEGKNIFYDSNDNLNLSQEAKWAIGGILKHARAIAIFTNPLMNSYARLVPGYEAPTDLVWSAHNRSAGLRVPDANAESKVRLEARFPDPAANGNLAFSALLMAMVHGIKNKIEPPEPVSDDRFEDKGYDGPQMPGSLQQAIDAFNADEEFKQFLMESGVFSQDLLDSYVGLLKKDIKRYVGLPHPADFQDLHR